MSGGVELTEKALFGEEEEESVGDGIAVSGLQRSVLDRTGVMGIREMSGLMSSVHMKRRTIVKKIRKVLSIQN